MSDILLTGGLGYIGSHVYLKLHSLGFNPVIIDNLSNTSLDKINLIELITKKKINFHNLDISDSLALKKILSRYNIKNIFHFAGFKSVSESVQNPLKYYINNVSKSITFLKTISESDIKSLIFSSSATVYGEPEYLPLNEDHKTNPYNPYGESKLIFEKICNKYCFSNPEFKFISLRYFNPIGSHESGVIGESIHEQANNIMPIILRTYLQFQDAIHIYGDDYKTKDGTGIRDYIHIDDLVEGHLSAYKNLEKLNGFNVFNLGTSKGYSVFDLIKSFEKVSQKKLPVVIKKRRDGDLAEIYADSSKAKKILNWNAKKELDDMTFSALNWANKYRQLINE
jgi:UDP-glucose 4-epimerase